MHRTQQIAAGCVSRRQLKYRFVILVLQLVVFIPFSFSQVVFDTVQVTDTLVNADSVSNKGLRFMKNQAVTIDSTAKIDSTLTAISSSTHRRKLKNNQFVWNDRKYSGDTSSGVKVKRHSALYATLFSMAVPGLGQAYNCKYWKIPIVYAGLGGLGYALYYTTSNFYGYRNAYRLEVDEDPATLGEYKGVTDAAELKSYRDYYKRYVDLTAILTGVWYALNLVDAAVDAHLFEWNMKDDIHLSWQPAAIPAYNQAAVPGVRLSLSF